MAQGNTFNAALQCLRATKRPALRLAFQLIDSQIVRCDVRRSVTFALWLPAAARQIAVIGRVAAVAPRTAPVTGRAAVPHYGSFLIVAAREIRADLANVVLHDVRVVEQPLTGWADVDASVDDYCKPVVNLLQNFLAVVETKQ